MKVEGCNTLIDWVRRVRPHAIERDDVLVVSPVPLMVVAAYLLDEEEMFRVYDEVLAGGHPDDLDPSDRTQTSRLESAVLEACGSSRLQLRELLSIEWNDPELGPDLSVSLIIGFTSGQAGLLIVHVPDEVPAFQVVAVSETERSLHAIVADSPHLVLPRLASQGSKTRQVVLRYFTCWSAEDVSRITDALVGSVPCGGESLRWELLALQEDSLNRNVDDAI